MAIETIEPIEADQAQQFFLAHPVFWVGEQPTPGQLADCGQAFRVKTAKGQLVMVVRINGKQLWVIAASGTGGDDLTQIGLAVVEEIAKQLDCHSVGFESARPGLERKSRAHGYTVASRKMVKVLNG